MNGNDSIRTPGEREGRSAVPRWLLATLAVLVLALAVSCGGAPAGGGGGQAPPEESAGEDAPAGEDAAALGREPLGEAGAPVVLTEYADYQ